MTEKQLHLRVKLIVCAAAAVVLALLIFIAAQLINLSGAGARAAQVIRQKEELLKQEQELQERIEKISTREYIEKYAREKLGYGYKGETRYFIKEDKD